MRMTPAGGRSVAVQLFPDALSNNDQQASPPSHKSSWEPIALTVQGNDAHLKVCSGTRATSRGTAFGLWWVLSDSTRASRSLDMESHNSAEEGLALSCVE